MCMCNVSRLPATETSPTALVGGREADKHRGSWPARRSRRTPPSTRPYTTNRPPCLPLQGPFISYCPGDRDRDEIVAWVGAFKNVPTWQ